jgi:hypothetical protein
MLRTMADAHKLPMSFDEWEKRAHEAISMIVSQWQTGSGRYEPG